MLRSTVFFVYSFLVFVALSVSAAYGRPATQKLLKELQPTSVDDQLQQCLLPDDVASLDKLRLVIAWQGNRPAGGPIKRLRDILTDEMHLPKLAFQIGHVRIRKNYMIFNMKTGLATIKVYRKYCNLLRESHEYAQGGASEKPFDYEIAKTKLNFYR